MSEEEGQRRDLVLASLLTSVDSCVKSVVCSVRRRRYTWTTQRDVFQSACAASTDALLTSPQWVYMKKTEPIIELFSRIIELVGKMEKVEHSLAALKHKRASLKNLPSEYEVTSKAKMSAEHDYNQPVSKLIVRQSCLKNADEA